MHESNEIEMPNQNKSKVATEKLNGPHSVTCTEPLRQFTFYCYNKSRPFF